MTARASDMQAKTELIPIKLPVAKAFLLRGPEGCVLIDTGIPPALEKLKLHLQELVPTFRSIKLILMTHGHSDHIGGAKELRELTGAPIAMHGADAGMADGTKAARFIPRTPAGRFAMLFAGMMRIKADKQFTPDILISDEGFDLRPYGVEADVIHTPGHTAGSLSVQVGLDVIVGDLIMPSAGRPSWPDDPMFADDLDLVRKSVKQVLWKQPRIIYCSHGGPFEFDTVAHAFGISPRLIM